MAMASSSFSCHRSLTGSPALFHLKFLGSSSFTVLKSSTRRTAPSLQISHLSASSETPLTVGNPISTRPMTLKSRLAKGDLLYGIFLLGFAPTFADIAGLAGYDFAVVDMEHGEGNTSEALSIIRALSATQTPAIVRLPESSATWAKKALDLGPEGIMFPMIESHKDGRKAVSYCRFPPDGVRGSAHTVVRASRYGIDDGYLENYKNELFIMCQVETKDGVEKVEEIAEVEGVDCIQMGPLDLSASIGYLWDPGHKKAREVLRTAEKGVIGVKKAYLSGFSLPHDPPEALRARGYHMISGAVDVGLFRAAAVQDVQRFKSWKETQSNSEVKEVEYWSE